MWARLTIGEAAERLGVSNDTVRRRIQAGMVPGACRAGDSPNDPWLIPVEAVEDLRPAGGVSSGAPVQSPEPPLTPHAHSLLPVDPAPPNELDDSQTRHIESLENHIRQLNEHIDRLNRLLDHNTFGKGVA